MHIRENLVPIHAPLDLAQVLERITDAFLALDLDWRLIYVNRKTEVLAGLERDQMIGQSYWDLFPKTIGSRVEFEYRRAMSEQKPAHFTVLSPMLSVWLDISAYPSPDGLTIYFRDVSDRVEAEREEARGREQQRAATELGQLALAGCSIAELRAETARALMHTLHIDAVEIRECSASDPRLHFVAGTHWLSGAIGREWVGSDSFAGFAAASGRSVASEDIFADERFSDRALTDGGIASGICTPITHLDAALGVICVYSREPRAYSQSEAQFVETLAVTLAETTALLATQEALRDSNRQVTDILESITDGFVSVDEHLIITHANRNFIAWSTHEREQLLGHSFDLIFSELHIPEVEEKLLAAHRERHHVYLEFYFAPRQRWYEARAFPWRDGLSIYFRDITRRKGSEAEIRSLNMDLERRVLARTAQLESANKELESFSYSVSHDLRAPLRAIDGFSQALQEDYGSGLDQTARSYVERVRSAAGRMAELIDALLELARVSRAPITAKPVDLCELVALAAADLHLQEPQRVVDVKIDGPAVVSGERSLLVAMIDNLVANAWKFTRPAQRASIYFGPLTGSPQTYVIRDNGAGFDMTYAGKLFGAFARMHSADEFEGTGIGLATVARIVQRHGGRIWAEGKPGAGAAFFFTLPETPAK